MNKLLGKVLLFFLRLTMICIWLGIFCYGLRFAYVSIMETRRLAMIEMQKYNLYKAERFKVIEVRNAT
jgi:hypothetical protein